MNKKVAITQMQTLSIMFIVFLVLFFIIAIPFYNSIKQKQAVVAYRRIYSMLQQANRMYSLVNGRNMNEYDTTLPINKFAETYFTPYLSIDLYCKQENPEDCWNSTQYKDLKNNKYNNVSLYSILLEDKTVIGFHKNSKGLITLIIDVDGKGGKNKLGKDIFVFYVYSSKFVQKLCSPEKYDNILIKDGLHLGGYDECGIPQDTYDYNTLLSDELYEACNKKAKSDTFGVGVGAACGALISKSNWVIDKNYPW